MKTIPVGRRGDVALVDDDNYPMLAQYKWTPTSGRNTVYAVTHIYVAGQRKRFRMHRMCAPTVLMIDHIDGNGLNNQRSNLRPCDHSTNGGNRSKSRHNTTGFKGVQLDRRTGKYRAIVEHQRIRYSLGYYVTAQEAARAYDKKAIELFGEFANTNFPRSDYDSSL
jgi:hypothetical protein